MLTLPCLSVHGQLHYHAPEDAEDSFAGIHLLLQQQRDLSARLQQENVRRVCQEYLALTVHFHSVRNENRQDLQQNTCVPSVKLSPFLRGRFMFYPSLYFPVIPARSQVAPITHSPRLSMWFLGVSSARAGKRTFLQQIISCHHKLKQPPVFSINEVQKK